MALPSPQELDRLLDRVKTSAFMDNNAAFLGSLLCQLEGFIWDEKDETASTDGKYIYWSIQHFMRHQEAQRKTVLLHEIWHNGRLHFLRMGNRDPYVWNMACDYEINNQMENDGYDFTGLNGLINHAWDGKAAEEIYDILIAQGVKPPPGWKPDIRPAADTGALINQVVMAVQQAKQAGTAGLLPGSVQMTIDGLLEHKVPWENYLYEWMSERVDMYYTWRRPNRRYNDVYMPSIDFDEGGLEHLAYFLDCSGSISMAQLRRFNSELKFIKQQFEPKKLTVVCFDTKIGKVKVFEEDDEFDKLTVHGRGGTSMVCVQEWIDKHRPTAAVIFSDMECAPMPQPKSQTPILWAISGTRGHKPSYGQSVYVPD